MTAPTRYTDDQLLDAMGAALEARDMPGVAALLRMLAVQAPHKADAIYTAIKLGRIVATEVPE